jgi:competence protein ComEC
MNPWNGIPFVRILIAQLIGILLAINIPAVADYNWFVILFSMLFIHIAIMKIKTSYQFRFLKGIPLILFFIIAGILLVKMHTEIQFKTHFSKTNAQHYLIKITDSPQKKSNSVKIVGKVLAVKSKGQWQASTGNLLVYISKTKQATQLNYGDVIICNSKVMETPAPKNPGEFNYKKYLAFHQIYHQTYLSSHNWAFTGKNESNQVLKYSYKIRNYFLKTLADANLTGDEFAIGSALIFGYEDNLSNEVIGSFAATGALHVLSVSGLHVGIVFLILTFFLKFLGNSKRARITALLISLAGLWLYALISGMSPSVWRAATMFSLITLGKFYKKDISTINVIGCSAFILLCINPYMITEVGFQLSYLAVIGIVTIHPVLYALVSVKNKILDQVWTISCVSLSAQLITFPLGLLYFHQFPNYFIFSNLFVIPLSTIILYGGVLLLAVAKIPVAGFFVAKLLSFLLWLLKSTVTLFENMPYAIIDGISITSFEAILIYAILLTLWHYWNEKKYISLNLSLLLCIIFCAFQINEKLNQKTQEKIIFYAINKHAAVDFISGNQHVLLADSSLLSNADKMRFHIVPNLNQLGIDKASCYNFKEGISLKNKMINGNENYVIFKHKILLNTVFEDVKIKQLIYIPDIVLINQHNLSNLKLFCQLYPNAKYICDGTISTYLYKKLVVRYKQINIRSVLNEGAITIEV